nr:ATP synthase F0 subunit 8 [Ophiusa tirhaca]
MPQMMPINEYIFFFFYLNFLFYIMNYYIYNININNKINFFSYKKKNLIWKW